MTPCSLNIIIHNSTSSLIRQLATIMVHHIHPITTLKVFSIFRQLSCNEVMIPLNVEDQMSKVM